MKRIMNHAVLAFIFATQSLWLAGCTNDPNVAIIRATAGECEVVVEIEVQPMNGTTVIATPVK